MSTTYQLYGGPLDGGITQVTRPLDEGDEVVMDLVRSDLMPTGVFVHRRIGEAEFRLVEGRLVFIKQKTLNHTK